MKILTLGTFDLPHIGHLDLIKKIEPFGDLTIGVNSDEFVQTFKPKPIMNQDERMMFWKMLGYDVRLNQDCGTFLINLISPDVIAVGSDWLRKDYLKQIGMTVDELEERNISLWYINRPNIMSSTEIKRRINEQV